MFNLKNQSLLTKCICCFLLVFASDILFYGHPVGWTAGLYAVLILAVLLAFNQRLLPSLIGKIIVVSTLVLIVNLIEEPDLLTVVMTWLGLISLIILQKRQEIPTAWFWLNDIHRFMSRSCWQWRKDYKTLKSLGKTQTYSLAKLRYACLPITLTVLFGALFSQANPIIAKGLSGMEFGFLNPFESFLRWCYWFWVGILIWGLLRPRFPITQVLPQGIELNLNRWLNQQTLILSLGIFNALFVIQNSLDIAFLWRGETLPMGVTYAEYSHAGAYPLFATNILTAAFVLLTFGDKQQQFQTNLAKILVFVWLGQNIFLVISAIIRLWHYIEVYSLTHLRIVAFIGMGLTAIGLVLIMVKIQYKRRNNWLINANAIFVVVTLYVACFINMDRLIADYNVRHAQEVTGTGSNIDLNYLYGLGFESLPALRWFQANAQYSPQQTRQAGVLITALENQLASDIVDWRAWTWRKQRLSTVTAAALTHEPIGNSG